MGPGPLTIPDPITPDQRPARRGVVLVVMMLVVSFGALTAWWLSARGNAAHSTTAEAIAQLDPDARAPDGMRVRVRVVNTTSTRALARRVTNYVRDLGYDVVDYGSDNSERRATTTIVVHTGHGEWARRLARGLDTDSIEVRPDSSRYIDLTVLIGTEWKPPAAQPFRP